ncbi:MAG TPA: hypothetical protein PKK95_15485, partial [Vicinamibacterales bacterium]|nr:hypothetical protein [Vicinamibacterales bacterium]
VAAHLIYEGLVAEGLAVTKAVRDRYDGERRNPWNEVECGSHYARALASWSLLTALAGYSYSAPEQRLTFAPRIAPEAFASFFTTGGGWGVFSQRADRGKTSAALDLRWGALELRRFGFGGTTAKGGRIAATVNGSPLSARLDEETIAFEQAVRLKAGDRLEVEISNK